MIVAIKHFTASRSRHSLTLATSTAALAAIIGALLADGGSMGGQWLHWICKPLVTVLIFLLAWRAVPALSLRYRLWILAGIACSLLGDILLMLPWDRRSPSFE